MLVVMRHSRICFNSNSTAAQNDVTGVDWAALPLATLTLISLRKQGFPVGQCKIKLSICLYKIPASCKTLNAEKFNFVGLLHWYSGSENIHIYDFRAIKEHTVNRRLHWALGIDLWVTTLAFHTKLLWNAALKPSTWVKVIAFVAIFPNNNFMGYFRCIKKI